MFDELSDELYREIAHLDNRRFIDWCARLSEMGHQAQVVFKPNRELLYLIMMWTGGVIGYVYDSMPPAAAVESAEYEFWLVQKGFTLVALGGNWPPEEILGWYQDFIRRAAPYLGAN